MVFPDDLRRERLEVLWKEFPKFQRNLKKSLRIIGNYFLNNSARNSHRKPQKDILILWKEFPRKLLKIASPSWGWCLEEIFWRFAKGTSEIITRGDLLRGSKEAAEVISEETWKEFSVELRKELIRNPKKNSQNKYKRSTRKIIWKISLKNTGKIFETMWERVEEFPEKLRNKSLINCERKSRKNIGKVPEGSSKKKTPGWTLEIIFQRNFRKKSRETFFFKRNFLIKFRSGILK